MPRIPGYRLHAQSGQAYVHLNGRQHLLGKFGTPDSHAKYARLLAEHASGTHKGEREASPTGITIAEVIEAFWKHAESYHTEEERTAFRYPIRLMRHLYGDTPAADFGPKALKAVREQMIHPLTWTDPDSGETYTHRAWCRKHANHQTNRLKHIFKWAVAEQLMPPSVHHGLQAVEALRRSKTTARESEPVQPAPEPMIAQVLAFLPKPVRSMVELESITGARGGELCIMRLCDIDFSDDACWVYRPTTHKTLHHGHTREVPLGKRCQEILTPYLYRRPTDFVFSPREAEAHRREQQAKARTTPIEQGNRPGSRKTRAPRRPPGERYTRLSYGRAILRACDATFPPPEELKRGRIQKKKKQSRRETIEEWRTRLGPEKWAQLLKWRKDHRFSPHRLRHTAATRLRKLFGLEAAGVVLGQKTMAATLIYAEQDRTLAAKVMSEIG